MSDRASDSILLDEFRRLLALGDAPLETLPKEIQDATLLDLARFMDNHGRRLLLLAEACLTVLARRPVRG